jgi:formate dehydrogenase iron-sulfur subunit
MTVPRAILVDAVRCIGCEACVEACQEANKQPEHEAKRFDAQTFTYLSKRHVRGEERHVRRLCMHCLDPTCVSVCPVAALTRTPSGAVTYDPDRCMGCRYCLFACPFDVPSYEWSSRQPRVRKCEMCSHRREGPACTEVCPEEATLTGTRAAMLGEARRRLKAAPRTYHPQIYGLREVGGTNVLIIGPAPPAALGLPRVMTNAMPALTWDALHHVPDVVLFGTLALGGLYWLTNRRERVRREEEDERKPHSDDGDDEGGQR